MNEPKTQDMNSPQISASQTVPQLAINCCFLEVAFVNLLHAILFLQIEAIEREFNPDHTPCMTCSIDMATVRLHGSIEAIAEKLKEAQGQHTPHATRAVGFSASNAPSNT